MADALGLAASVIAVIQLTASVASLSYEYIGKAAQAPRDLSKLIDELKSLHEVLTILHVSVQANPESMALRGLDDPLRECMAEMIKLRVKLEPKKNPTWFEMVLVRLKWPFEEKETSDFISRVERLKSLFSLALNTDQLSLSKAIEADVQDIKAGIEVLKSKTVIQDSDRKDGKMYQIGRDRTEALNWLYPETFDERHIEISGKRQENTCEWILKRPEVLEWVKKNPNSRLLWGYGIPGAGKTFLSSRMIDHLQKEMQTENYGVAYIYFNYKERGQQSPIRVVSSLVKQFACQIPHLPKEIEDLRKKLEPQQKRPTLEELNAALLVVSSAKYFTQTFVVCDALDECDQGSQREQLLPLFHRMGKSGINLFLTSREHPEDIQHSLHRSAKVRLSAQDEDIASYIERRIAENPRANRLIGQSKHKAEVVSKLTECANGMFLLVHFQIEHLCKQTTMPEILRELESLRGSSVERPLDPTYDRAMDVLRNQPKNCIELALKVLSWLVKGQKVFMTREIQMAVSIKQGQTNFNEQDLPDKKTLLDVCAGLVTIDDASDTVRLAHYTVQEYLLEHSILPGDADFQLAIACITLLSFDIFAQGACDSFKSFETRTCLYPFMVYAAQNLSFHLNACDEALTTELVHKFLGRPGSISSYLQARSFDQGYLGRHQDSGLVEYPGGQVSLHIAAFLGHRSVVRLLLDHINISVVDDRRRTALHIAADQENESVVLLLLEKGADISAADKAGRTALHLAISRGNESVILLLLEKGADISAADKLGRTALHLATYRGNESVVLLLLEKGADISAGDGHGYTALYWAIGFGHESMVLLLLEKGADILAADKDGQTALHLAAFEGNESVVLLLLEKGADILAADRGGRTALHLATSKGNESVALLLLEKGVDISTLDCDGKTAMELAVDKEHGLIVHSLKQVRPDR